MRRSGGPASRGTASRARRRCPWRPPTQPRSWSSPPSRARLQSGGAACAPAVRGMRAKAAPAQTGSAHLRCRAAAAAAVLAGGHRAASSETEVKFGSKSCTWHQGSARRACCIIDRQKNRGTRCTIHLASMKYLPAKTWRCRRHFVVYVTACVLLRAFIRSMSHIHSLAVVLRVGSAIPVASEEFRQSGGFLYQLGFQHEVADLHEKLLRDDATIILRGSGSE